MTFWCCGALIVAIFDSVKNVALSVKHVLVFSGLIYMRFLGASSTPSGQKTTLNFSSLYLILSLILVCGGCVDSSDNLSRSEKADIGSEVHLYYTVGILEPDKITSGWLITRHIDRGAEVHYLPEGAAPPEKGTAFDLPGARWSRNAQRATYEEILYTESSSDSALFRIGSLLHASEFSAWILPTDSPEKKFDMLLKKFSFESNREMAFTFLDSLWRNDGVLSESLVREFGGL